MSSDRFVWNGLLSLSLIDRQKRPGPRTQALKTNKNKINSRIILSLLIRLQCSCSGTRLLLSVVWLFLSLTGGTPHSAKNFTLRFRQTPPVGQKKQDDTRQSSNGPRTRTPPTHVITAWKTNCDLKGINFYQTTVFLNPYLRD